MTITIELSADEKLALEKALGIIGNMALLAEVSKGDVIDYLSRVALIDDKREWHITTRHNTNEIKQIKGAGE